MSSNTKPKQEKRERYPPPLPTSPPPSLNSKENVNPEGETRKVECPFSSEQHEGKEFAHVTLSLPPQEVYRSSLLPRGAKSEENGDTTRTITYTANLPSKALGPSISHVTEVQTISGKSQANDLYVVNCIVQNSGIPYGDSFKIHIHYCIIKERSQNSLPQTKFAYYCIVKFKKAPLFFIKTMIEKNTYDGLQSVCEELVNALSNEADKSDGIVTRPKRKRGNSTIDGSEVNKKKKETEETSKGFSKRSITELTDVIEQLPAYMVDFMSLTAELENKNLQKVLRRNTIQKRDSIYI
ncbi:GRAM domain-containing protein 1B [Armadillidium vulgare]|nr:GRAM domain-containing protein 1B [Armadillidium vulgare]